MPAETQPLLPFSDWTALKADNWSAKANTPPTRKSRPSTDSACSSEPTQQLITFTSGSRLTEEQQRLVEANLGLVYNLVGKFRFPQAYHDDAVSDAMLALVHAARGFKADRIGKFSAFAYLCIERRLKSLYNRILKLESRRASDVTQRDEWDDEWTENGQALHEPAINDAPYVPVLDDPQGTRRPMSKQCRAFGDLAPVVWSLRSRHRRVLCAAYVRSTRVQASLTELACTLRCTRQEARERLQEALAALRRRLLREWGDTPPRPWSVADDDALRPLLALTGMRRQLVLMLLAQRWQRSYREVKARANYLQQEADNGT